MSTKREVALSAWYELSDLLTILRTAGHADEISSNAVAGVAELALKRANVMGGFIDDLPDA